MVDKKELENEELTKITGGNKSDGSINVIKNAIYRGVNIYVYVDEVYNNEAVSYYGAKYSNGIYKYGGRQQKTTAKNFCNMFDVSKPITNVIVEKA